MPHHPAKIQKAIDELIDAAQGYAFKGSQPPSAHELLEARFECAKLYLEIMAGAVEATRARMKRLHDLQEVVDEGYDGPTDEERGG